MTLYIFAYIRQHFYKKLNRKGIVFDCGLWNCQEKSWHNYLSKEKETILKLLGVSWWKIRERGDEKTVLESRVG